ncbi:hypothetical protein MCOR02_000847 [Pyricularia oryzae]|nr:hypothetical protein MCOR02_000847 [Pyricularia oryzae]
MVPSTFTNRVQPIDEDSPVDPQTHQFPTDPSEPVMIASHGRTPSSATTIRPPTAASSQLNPFATPATRSRSSSLATAIGAPPVDVDAALRPDPGTEADFKVDNNPFAFSPGQLGKLLNPKSLDAFRALGGLKAPYRISFDHAVNPYVKSSEKHANTAAPTGSGRFVDRARVFGKNVLPSKKATPLYKLMWNAYKEKVLIVLSIAAAISLALGLYETFGAEHPPGSPLPVDWVEGVAIVVAVVIVVVVGGLMDWQKERAFVRLNKKKDDREIKVIRSGRAQVINVEELLVGDVIQLEPGDVIPVDGIFISGHDVKCDESTATGESDALKKTGGEQVMRMLESGTKVKDLDPFIISGARVLEGW